MEADLKSASKVVTWNRRVLKVTGLCPGENNDFLCVFAVVYMFVQCSAGFAELLRTIGSADLIETVAEFVVFSVVLIKVVVFRVKSSLLNNLMNDIEQDFSREVYDTQEDCAEFLKYNTISKLFMKVVIFVWILTAAFYYMRPVLIHFIVKSSANGTLPMLPYRTRFMFEVTEFRTYVTVYVYEIIVPVIAISGYMGADVLLVTLIFHLCGQYAALAHQINHSVGILPECRPVFSKLASRHQRLIRTTEAVNNSFGIVLLCQLLSISYLLCFLWYNIIYVYNNSGQSTSEEQYSKVIALLLFQGIMLLSLFGYCFIGECLSYESTKIAEALCMCEWYTIMSNDLKYFHICLLRAQHPAVLTAGKFFSFSFINFTGIIKTSMAYLSFLRNLL